MPSLVNAPPSCRSTSSSDRSSIESTTARRRRPAAADRTAVEASRPPVRRVSASEIVGRARRGRIVEQQRRRQRSAERRAQRVAQLHRQQRIEAQLAERRARIDRPGGVQAERARRPCRARMPRAAAGAGCGAASASYVCRSRLAPAHAAVGADGRARAPASSLRKRGSRHGTACCGVTRASRSAAPPPARCGWRAAARSACSPCAGVIAPQPSRRHALDDAAIAAAPTSLHAPQLMLSAGSPRDRRACASWSRKALAAAWLACPGEPSTRGDRREQHEEVERIGPRQRRRAPARPRPWRAKTLREPRARPAAARRASSSAPALWMTPRSGGPLRRRSRQQRRQRRRVGDVERLGDDRARRAPAQLVEQRRGLGRRRRGGRRAPGARRPARPASAPATARGPTGRR